MINGKFCKLLLLLIAAIIDVVVVVVAVEFPIYAYVSIANVDFHIIFMTVKYQATLASTKWA